MITSSTSFASAGEKLCYILMCFSLPLHDKIHCVFSKMNKYARTFLFFHMKNSTVIKMTRIPFMI